MRLDVVQARPARSSVESHTTARNCFGANLGHFEISKLIPQILHGVDSNQGRTEQANHLDTTDTANAQSGQEKPREPFQGEALMLQPVEPGPAKNCGEGEAQEHRIEQDESRDSSVRVLKEHHESNQPDRDSSEPEFARSVIRQWHTNGTKEGVEDPHEHVVHIFWVFLSGFELEGSVITSEVAGQAHQYLPQRRVDIEIELALQVMGTELAETERDGQWSANERRLGRTVSRALLLSFVPRHDVRAADPPHSCEKREGREDQRRQYELPFIQDSRKGLVLSFRTLVSNSVSRVRCRMRDQDKRCSIPFHAP